MHVFHKRGYINSVTLHIGAMSWWRSWNVLYEWQLTLRCHCDMLGTCRINWSNDISC